MKYCVSARQPDNIIKQADEIKLNYADMGYIYDLIEKFQNKEIIMRVPKVQDQIDWEQLCTLNEIIPITLALEDISGNFPREALEHSIPYFWNYPVTSWFELDSLKAINVSQIIIGMPLIFEMRKVKNKIGDKIKVRIIPNIAYDAYIPRENGIECGYVRPEDIAAYEPYVDVVEFLTKSTKQEGTLFTIYAVEKQWPGNLNLLITNLNYNVDNRGLPDDFAERRMNCGQHCMSHGTCHYCRSAFLLCRTIDKVKYAFLDK